MAASGLCYCHETLNIKSTNLKSRHCGGQKTWSSATAEPGSLGTRPRSTEAIESMLGHKAERPAVPPPLSCSPRDLACSGRDPEGQWQWAGPQLQPPVPVTLALA